mgnify:CR=1 FL=1
MKIGIITAMSSEQKQVAQLLENRKNTPKVLSNILKAALEIIPLS